MKKFLSQKADWACHSGSKLGEMINYERACLFRKCKFSQVFYPQRGDQASKDQRGYVSSLFAVAVYLEYGHGHPQNIFQGVSRLNFYQK